MAGFPPRPITLESVAVAEDADELWRAFLDANHARDLVLADAIRKRLAVLQRDRTASDLDDDQLKAQIITLRDDGDHDSLSVVEAREATTGLSGWARRTRVRPVEVADPVSADDLATLLEEAQRRGIEV